LSDLPGLTWRVDQETQTLYVTTSDDHLLPALLLLDESERSVGHHLIESGIGVTINYDIAGTLTGSRIGGSGSLDMRAFSPWGVISSGWLASTGATAGGSGSNTAIRLDSTYSFADVNSLFRYSLGDFITGGLGWTRPIRLEGAQVRSDFSMRPDLVTFPLPSVTGSVAVPSTVDVLADGNLELSRQIDAGPFEIPQLPVVSGAGTISMVVTNSLGQQVTVTQPFYASAALLAPGLQTFSAQAGLVRHNWGSVSNDYGKIAGTVVYRRGLTRKVTIEGSAEGTQGTGMAGAGSVVQIGNLGVVNFAAATSTGSGRPGAQFSAGAQRIGRVFSLGASAIIAGRTYRDVASMNGDGVLRKQLSAFTSLSMKRLGSAGVTYAGIDQDAPTGPAQLQVASAEHTHVFSANYSLPFHRFSIYVNEFRDLSSAGSGGLQFGLTVPLGRRSSAGVSGMSDGSVQAQAQMSAAMVGDWGYQAYISAGHGVSEFTMGQYKSPWSLLSAGINSTGGQTTLRLESQAAISLVDGGLFPSNTIYDSFAIVDSSPMAHIHVLQENRDVGRTDSAGRLLVPDMRSFDLNHIAIEPNDIPPDSSIDVTAREVRPQDRSGIVVRFPTRISHAAMIRLVDEAGAPVPVGSTAKLIGTGVIGPVGYDGEAYIQDLSRDNQVSVDLPDGRRCTVAFNYRPIPGDIPIIGPLRCMEPRP
jgi:outer membrane usher protein